jgi:hypothetical protein
MTTIHLTLGPDLVYWLGESDETRAFIVSVLATIARLEAGA